MENWMIFAAIAWVVMALISTRIICNVCYNGNYGWDLQDTGWVVLSFLVPPIIILVCLSVDGEDCFRKSKTQIYWNKRENQIMTRSGICLYDRLALNNKINNIQDSIRDIIRSDKEAERQSDIDNAKINLENERINADNAVIDKKEAQDDLEWEQMKIQLKCSAKTKGKHKIVFDTGVTNERTLESGFRFYCTVCRVEIVKVKSELTATEITHLKGLKLL